MHDAHFHISDEWIEQTKNHPIKGIVNASNEKEYDYVKQFPVIVSVGIHPWYVDTTNWDDIFPCMEQAKIIGEIGLDNTWCSTDLTLQKEVFEKQLAYAAKNHKPVILHLKGMEKEAYSLIKKYSNTYIVHWHSTKEMIQEYIDLDCFFTIGPSIGIDEAVNEVCRKCPLDRMLMESDGINAIGWAFECDDQDVQYFKSLERSIQEIANIKKKSFQEIETQLDKNFNILEKLIGMNN